MRRRVECFLVEFHCEVNPIERVWAQAKRCTKAYCNYTLPSLREKVTPALECNIGEHAETLWRVRHYMFAHLEGAATD